MTLRMQVSEWRHGEVSFDTDGSVVIKPLAGQGKSANGPSTAEQAHADTEEAQEEEEGMLALTRGVTDLPL